MATHPSPLFLQEQAQRGLDVPRLNLLPISYNALFAMPKRTAIPEKSWERVPM